MKPIYDERGNPTWVYELNALEKDEIVDALIHYLRGGQVKPNAVMMSPGNAKEFSQKIENAFFTIQSNDQLINGLTLNILENSKYPDFKIRFLGWHN